MKECRYTALECTSPHLKCGACQVYRKFREDSKRALAPRGTIPRLPDPCPYVKFVTPYGSPGIEIGIKGTF